MDRLRRILDHLAGSYYKYGTRPWNSLRYGKPRECDPALSFINNLKVQGAPLEERNGGGRVSAKMSPFRVGNRLTESSAQHRPLLCFPPVVLSLTKRMYRNPFPFVHFLMVALFVQESLHLSHSSLSRILFQRL